MSAHKGDERLMQLVATGDRAAQELVLRRVRRRVHVVSSAILKHAQDAEDATQAALIQILRGAASFRGDSAIEGWATRVAVREAVRLSQERRLRAARTAPESRGSQVESTAPVELSWEIPRHIRDYLNELPQVLRNALVLRHVLGYTVAEMAELLDTPANTIKDRLTRARVEIRRMIRRDLLASAHGRAKRS